ncbi:MAG TPA: CoA pyrophosphatase [Polyangiaceae bacterium LLY-WYZ-15_(1-7)]|nr:CoA pyrophosphatase [Polyangiaceae bacterium LLY-WYZ-15_(1-7)]
MTLEQLHTRIAELEPAELEAPKRAAVATVLRPRGGELEGLFIRRAEHPDDPWSGHMAFPGGRQDPEDATLLDTARRETLEEVGLDLGRAALLGPLDDVQTHRKGLIVRPYVFALEGEPALEGNYEVAEVLWVPLGPLLRGERDTTYPLERDGQTWRFPAYDADGRIIWGLTYRMLQLLFRLLRP